LTGDGFALNSSGLKVASGTNSVTIDAANGLILANAGNIGGWTINSTEIKRSATGQGTLSLNSSLGYISVSSDNVANTLAGINSANLATDITFWSGGTGPLDFDSSFIVDLSGKLFARNADISGKIEAESGYIGTAADGWNIDTNGITSVGAGRIKLGNYSMQSLNGTDFGIYDISTLETQGRRQTLIRTETIPQATDPGRIYIGDPRRQVEVAKSAQVSADGSSVELDSFTDSDAPTINAYRSGGLRNMFTAKLAALNANTNPDTGTISLYPSAEKGSVLVVYHTDIPNDSDSNPWRKVHSVYLNTRGVSGLTYYYAGYSEYNGVCLSAPGADGTTYETLNLPTGITIQPGTTLTQVFANNSSSGEVVWGVYSTFSFEEAINKLNEHATSRDSACAPGQFTVPNFVGLPQPPSTDQYNIVLGDNEPTNSPVLFGTVFSQSPAAGSREDEGIDIIINMYVASTIPQFEVPDFVGLAQPPSTDDYNIVLGTSVITNSPTLAGTVQGQNVLAYSFQNVGIDITIYMYVLATPTSFTVPNFVGQAQPPSTSDYTIALGPDTTTNTSSLWGTVATQDQAAGSSQPIGTTITISMYVAPPAPTTFTVPNFVGGAQPPSTSDYTIALGDSTLTNTPSLAGTVATQDKEAGSTQAIGTTITISMYVLQPTFTVPNFVGGAQPPSTSDYTIVLGPDTITSSPALFGTVATQDKAAGSSQPVGTTITISMYVAAPPPFFPPYFPFFPPYFPFFPPYFPFFSPTNPPPFFPPYFPFFSPTNPPPFFPPYFPSFSISDERDKINIEPLSIGIDFVNDLSPFTYTWNMRDESCVGVEDFGFIAQDLAALEDSVDGHERLRLTNRENPDKLMISQDRLIPILVKAIQDLSNQIEDLKKD
jgi:RNA-binding protein 16